MDDFGATFWGAFRLIATGDPALLEVVGLSLTVSGLAVAIACAIGLPLGAMLAVAAFPGRRLLIVLTNALMGLPPVVVGLIVYMALSRSGPLGVLGLLYTPSAMVIAQTLLVTPIVVALSRQVIADLDREYDEMLRAMDVGLWSRTGTLLHEGRHALLTVALAGFGRAIAEVGAVLIVGGNIAHVTRVMTTTIALETSKGNLELALGLGAVLMVLAIGVNAAVYSLRSGADRLAYG